jgi:hypothetical protein
MDTGLFFCMSKITKIEDFKWLHTKTARLNFFEIWHNMYYLTVNHVANTKKIELEEKIGIGWNYYLKVSSTLFWNELLESIGICDIMNSFKAAYFQHYSINNTFHCDMCIFCVYVLTLIILHLLTILSFISLYVFYTRVQCKLVKPTNCASCLNNLFLLQSSFTAV